MARTLNYIGKSNWAADATFSGSIAEFAIYAYPLSSTQITNHFKLGFYPVLVRKIFFTCFEACGAITQWRGKVAPPSRESATIPFESPPTHLGSRLRQLTPLMESPRQ